jgi:hypothetical protein
MALEIESDLRISLPFNGDFLDKSGNGNDVTPSGIILKTDTPKIGSGYVFGDGINDDGEIADSPSLDSTRLVFATWIRFTTSGTKIPFERSNGSFLQGDWHLLTLGGKVRFTLGIAAGNQAVDSTSTIRDGNWHLVVAQYDGRYMRMFIDNVYEAVTDLGSPFDIVATNKPLTLFARKGKVIPFPGSLDSFLMGGSALSYGGVSIGQQATGGVAELWNGGAGVEFDGVGEVGEFSHVALSIYDKQFNAFKELSGKNTII